MWIQSKQMQVITNGLIHANAYQPNIRTDTLLHLPTAISSPILSQNAYNSLNISSLQCSLHYFLPGITSVLLAIYSGLLSGLSSKTFPGSLEDILNSSRTSTDRLKNPCDFSLLFSCFLLFPLTLEYKLESVGKGL